MTRRYGIDTSVLVRLLTGTPPDTFYSYFRCHNSQAPIKDRMGREGLDRD